MNWQVNSSSNLASFFIVMTQNSHVKFKLIHFYFEQKNPIKVPIFSLPNMLWWEFTKFFMSFLKARVSSTSNVVSVFITIKHNSPIPLSGQTLYTLFKRSTLKCKFLRFSSPWVKICQIPHVNFELTSQFLFKFSIILYCHDTKLPCKF